jgi:hypothetical protein
MGKFGLKAFLLALMLFAWNCQPARAGSIVRLYFDGITGTSISNLTQNAIFPNGSDFQEVLTDYFEGKPNNGDNYGSWIRGYIEAPQTGNYTFYIASDDPSQLWLSSDTTQAHTNLIAYIPDGNYSGEREYNKFASQTSTNVISLTKGQKYYVEVFQKEGTGGDNLSVGWRLPDGTLQRPIPGYYLEPYNPPGTTLAITQQPTGQAVTEMTPAIFFVNVDAATPPTFQWYKNGAAMAGENLSVLILNPAKLSDNGALYTVKINGTLTSDPASLAVFADTTPPTIVSASTFDYDSFVQVVYSKPVTPASATNKANYACSDGITVNSATMLDASTVRLRTSTFDLTKPHTLTISNIKDLAATPNTGGGTIQFSSTVVAYWPLDTIQGTTTPDTINGYDMTLLNLTSANLVTGKRGKCFSFSNASATMLYRNDQPGEKLPVYNTSNSFTIAFWVNGAPNQADMRVFSEGSVNSNNPLFNIGTANGGNSGLVDSYIRDDTNTSPGGHRLTTATAFDNTWHHIAYVQTGVNAVMYIDGVLDGIAVSPTSPLTLNTTSIGGIMRAAPGSYFTGLLDEVVIWGRALAASEVSTLFTQGFSSAMLVNSALTITNQPVSQTVSQPNSVTFSVGASGVPGALGIQWYRNGQPIAGANSLTYSIPTAMMTDNGATFYAVVTNLAYTVQSSTATLTVLADKTPPSVMLASTRIGLTVDVQFSELLDATTAVNKNNYSIANVSITGATLSADGMTVTLGIGGTLPANFEITISNIKDLAGNAIPTGTKVTGYTTGLSPGMISYWPLNEIQGTKTPDVVSGYDMILVNLTTNDLVAGKYGKCFQFDNARNTLLRRVHATNDLLPIYKYPTLTVSIWVNGAPNQNDRRIFAETSSTANNPMFDVGSQNVGTSSGLDSFIRNDTGGVTGGTSGHHYHTTVVYDNTWHHVVYVQHATNTTPRAEIYIDGVKDSVLPDPIWPLTVNTTTIGGIQRASAAAWFTGLIDDVAVWNRDLSPDEINFLYTKGTPTPTPKVLPLVINFFKSDFPAVAKGDSVVLRWDVSKDATSVSIQPDIGDVTTTTVVGAGSVVATLSQSKTYKLTIRRGTETVTQDLPVVAIDGVASGWTLLDNFDRYNTGTLPTSVWLANGVYASVVDVSGNRMLSPAIAAMVCALPLNTLTIKEGQQRTLFTRFYLPTAAAAGAVDELMGLTDKAIRAWADHVGDLGPGVHFQNVNGDLQIGTVNGYGSALEFGSFTLQPATAYNLWIDVQNDPIANGDSVSMYIAKDGTTTRTTLFKDYRSDRNPNDTSILGPSRPDLDKILIAANTAGSTVYFDDFYLSKSGYSSTVPHAFGFTPPIAEVVTTPPTLRATLTQGNVVISWPAALGTGYNLQSATSLSSPTTWTSVSQAVVASGTNSTVTIPASKNAEFYQLKK